MTVNKNYTPEEIRGQELKKWCKEHPGSKTRERTPEEREATDKRLKKLVKGFGLRIK